MLISAFVFSFMSDASFSLSNIRIAFPGYAALVIYGLSTSGLNHTQGVLSPSLGQHATRMACIVGATIIALPFYIFKTVIVCRPDPLVFMTVLIICPQTNAPDTPAVPLSSFIVLPVLAFSLLYLTPKTTAQVQSLAMPAQHYFLSYTTIAIVALILGPLAFSQFPSWTDCIVGGLLFYGTPSNIEG